ncbi:MAG: fumarylacetoacetate hydrolase family protein [Chitinophagaceae bacterium]|jgi:2-keto-4-pentenoate hydratase/2-oxohepta-3-ene-1,7-dioic acid hydratase in catechol pathway|nr:fumarylacetoacetate hydrolase family protein [Chitinophagaceae bacterium]
MKIICVGRNYADHAKELGNQVPDEPVIFLKPKNSLLSPGNNLFYPAFTNELHYECELVVKINKNGKFISPGKAKLYYEEVSLGIDFTARDIQDKLKKKSLPWEKAKAFDGSAAVGQFVPLSKFGNPKNLHFQLFKNGELVQDGHTADMLFGIDVIIADVSQYFSLNIGDLIYTGTPPGVGEVVISDRLEGYLEGEKLLDVMIE